jgi:hypothetical protein
MKKIFIIIFFIILNLIYFRQYFFQNQALFPGNLLVSFFSPYKEEIWPQYPYGVPRKDLLGFDTVRQMYPWRTLTTQLIKTGQWPLWNPYNFSGSPLLANFQTAIFYPPNLLYLVLPQEHAWNLILIFQVFFACFSFYLFAREIKLSLCASIITSISYAFSGLMAVWLPWNIYGHIFALLPLNLFLVEKNIKSKKWYWPIFLCFTLSFTLFAGHPQMFFLSFLLVSLYCLFGIFFFKKNKKNYKRVILKFIVICILAAILTSPQWLPTLEYYSLASREKFTSEFIYSERLLSYKTLLTFFAPDLFGNPATENFWGEGNYVENTAYVGVVAIFFALFALFHRKNKFITFFITISLIGLLFSLPSPITFLIDKFKIPFFSASISTRFLFWVSFSVCILAGFGIDFYIKENRPQNIKKTVLTFALIYLSLFLFLALLIFKANPLTASHFKTSLRNLILPSVVFFSVSTISFVGLLFKKHKQKILLFCVIPLVLDLFYLGNKLSLFCPKDFVFPQTEVFKFLQNQKDYSRYAPSPASNIDSNFATYYKIFSAEGYDTLYPRRYGELVWAAKTEEYVDDISRTVVLLPQEESENKKKLLTLLSAKYILFKNDLMKGEWTPDYNLFPQSDYRLLWQQGKWQVYEFLKALPHSFLVGEYELLTKKEDIIRRFYSQDFNPEKKIILEESLPKKIKIETDTEASVKTITYSPLFIELESNSKTNSLLFLSDVFYPGWKASVDNIPTKIYLANYTFRAIIVPQGFHKIKFTFHPDNFYLALKLSVVTLIIMLIYSLKKIIFKQ